MFINWITGNMGSHCDNEYPPMFFVTIAIIALIVVLFIVFGSLKRIPYETKNKVLKGVAIFQLSFEIIWRLLYVFVKKDSPQVMWPMYPCNLGGVILPIICLLDWKPGKGMFYLFGIVGALLTFAMPGEIFNNTAFVFPILKSVLQHTGLLIIPALEYSMNKYRPSIRQFPLVFLGCLIHLINSEAISRLFPMNYDNGTYWPDYIFLRSGMPFTIPGVWQPLIFCPFALLVLFILSFLCNTKDSIKTLRDLKLLKNTR